MFGDGFLRLNIRNSCDLFVWYSCVIFVWHFCNVGFIVVGALVIIDSIIGIVYIHYFGGMGINEIFYIIIFIGVIVVISPCILVAFVAVTNGIVLSRLLNWDDT